MHEGHLSPCLIKYSHLCVKCDILGFDETAAISWDKNDRVFSGMAQRCFKFFFIIMMPKTDTDLK